MGILIEYLLLFILLVLVCPNNVWTLGICAFFLLSYVFYACAYFINRKKCTCRDRSQVSIEFVMILLMIIGINAIMKLNLANLIFMGIVGTFLIVSGIRNIVKTDTWEKHVVRPTYIFDFYSVLYFANLVVMVLSYEI